MPFIGLVGCGNLGSAILDRWIENGVDPSLLRVVDNHPEKVAKHNFKVSSLSELEGVDVLVIAVKPWNVLEMLAQVNLDPDTVIVSMAAGIGIKNIAATLQNPQQPICRVMPNIGVRVGAGVLALAFNDFAIAEHRQNVKDILKPLGKTLELKEKDFDAVTALAGSGPAFISIFFESLIMGGIAGGLSAENSRTLALETVEATLRLCAAGVSFQEIQFSVSSPAGTTIAGLEALERSGFRGHIIECLRLASNRAAELGRESV